jgi:metal-responsive CopG/Arc/MetJ family transcriptional regulator
MANQTVKTYVKLSEELLKAIEQHTQQYKKSRSDFIETAVWAFIKQLVRNEINASDLDIINKRADYLNQEADDVLSYQVQI